MNFEVTNLTFSDDLIQVTKVIQVCPVVRVSPDFLVTPSRVKDSGEILGSQGDREVQATLDKRENLESWDSPACLDQG